MLLRKPSLVLRGHVSAKLDVRELPLGLVLGNLCLEELDGLAIGHAFKGLVDKHVQARRQLLVHKVAKELEIGGAPLPRFTHHVFDVALGIVHDVGELRKRYLRLYHVEFSKMALRLRVLCAKGGTERVDAAKSAGVRLRCELAGDSEESRLAKKVLGEVHRIAILALGHGAHLVGQRGHPEHFASALAVRGGDEGRLHIVEALLCKEGVCRLREGGSHARHGADEVGARPQVCNGAQELKTVALLLQWVCFIALADDLELRGLDLVLLTLALAENEFALRAHGRARADAGDHLLKLGVSLRIRYYLHTFEARPVIHLDEAAHLEGADGAHPPFDMHLRANHVLIRVKQALHHRARHRGGVRRGANGRC
mmetsp:Transcript_12185/g.29740  ORF Transcript_12185/g.29740 Transcript_12185/m.29740 type:complete len:369 (-) Transcript_12185:116-1222(-)